MDNPACDFQQRTLYGSSKVQDDGFSEMNRRFCLSLARRGKTDAQRHPAPARNLVDPPALAEVEWAEWARVPPRYTWERIGAVMQSDGRQRFAPEAYSNYVRLLARLWLPRRMRRKLDASDIVQDVLLAAHARQHQFEGASEGQYKAWLRRITQNLVLDMVKKRRLPEQSVQQVEDASRCTENWLAADGPSAGSQVAREELLSILAETLAELPDEWQEVLALHYFCGFKVGQIAEHLGRSRASVAGLLRRALDRLRQDSRLSL